MPEHSIYVKLLDEGTDVWRPVRAERAGAETYQIIDQEVPEDEVWEFAPGSLVIVTEKVDERGKHLVAAELKR